MRKKAGQGDICVHARRPSAPVTISRPFRVAPGVGVGTPRPLARRGRVTQGSPAPPRCKRAEQGRAGHIARLPVQRPGPGRARGSKGQGRAKKAGTPCIPAPRRHTRHPWPQRQRWARLRRACPPGQPGPVAASTAVRAQLTPPTPCRPKARLASQLPRVPSGIRASGCNGSGGCVARGLVRQGSRGRRRRHRRRLGDPRRRLGGHIV